MVEKVLYSTLDKVHTVQNCSQKLAYLAGNLICVVTTRVTSPELSSELPPIPE